MLSENKELQKYLLAFILYEIGLHGVDPRESLEGTSLRIKESEGYKYANKIHIHHIKPLFEIGETYEVDPVKDLIPVCPNCHMVLHTNGGISVEELRKHLAKKKEL